MVGNDQRLIRLLNTMGPSKFLGHIVQEKKVSSRPARKHVSTMHGFVPVRTST